MRKRDGVDLEDARGAERSLAWTSGGADRRACEQRDQECCARQPDQAASLLIAVHIWHCARCCLLDVTSAIVETSNNLLSKRRGGHGRTSGPCACGRRPAARPL